MLARVVCRTSARSPKLIPLYPCWINKSSASDLMRYRMSTSASSGVGRSLGCGVFSISTIDSRISGLTFDASKLALGDKYSHYVDVWVAYRYWQNKYGYDHNISGECTVNFVPGGQKTNSCTES